MRSLLVASLLIFSAAPALAQANPPVPTPRPEPSAARDPAVKGAPPGKAVEPPPPMEPVVPLEPSAKPADYAPEAKHFIVVGLAPDDLLNLRATASATGMTIGRLPMSATVTNLGCAEVGKYRWCKISDLDDPRIQGWAAARYLQATEVELPVGTDKPDADQPEAGQPDAGQPAAEVDDGVGPEPDANVTFSGDAPKPPAAEPAPAAPAANPPIKIDCSAPGVICENAK